MLKFLFVSTIRAVKRDASPPINLPHTWVRELRIDVIENKRPDLPSSYGKRFEDDWSNARVLVLGDDSRDAVCQEIEGHLTGLGARVLVDAFESAQSPEFRDTVDDFSHFIAVLPRRAKESNISEDHLKHIIRRLSFAAFRRRPAMDRAAAIVWCLSSSAEVTLEPARMPLFSTSAARPPWPRAFIWNARI